MSKNNDRYKVNFNNLKTIKVINYLQLAENRLSRDEIVTIGTKDILYQLSKNGYIKETSKGSFQGTKKLRDKVSRETGKQFGKGSSAPHSRKLLEVAKCIPDKVITSRHFQTGTELEKGFHKFKSTDEYKKRTEQVREEYISKINNLTQQHYNIQDSNIINQREKLQENITYLQSLSVLKRNLSIIEEAQYSVPDFVFSCSKAQGQEFLSNIEKMQDGGRRAATTQIKEIIEESNTEAITFYIEIITNNYGTEDLERHHLFDSITNTRTIYI